MLSPSVRRAAASSPQSPLFTTAAASVTRSTYRPISSTRRYSSSKPSRDDGSKAPPVRQQAVPATGEGKSKSSSASVSAPGERRKRKAKDAAEKLNYPSVPTTAHIPSDFFALSSFFSLHRPISVVRGVPRIVTDDAFASIFTPQTRSQRQADVMSTIARTIDHLERPVPTLSIQQQGAEDAAQQDTRVSMLNSVDGSDTLNVATQVNHMMGQYQPFRPPPPPQPEMTETATAESADDVAEAARAELQEDSQTRVYKAMFTIEETTDATGGVKIVAHSPELIEAEYETSESLGDASWLRPVLANAKEGGAQKDTQQKTTLRRPFIYRMRQRQIQYEERGGVRNTMLWAISVKRQRKLKMKKRKYKKLQKRLRHDRLKHGRT